MCNRTPFLELEKRKKKKRKAARKNQTLPDPFVVTSAATEAEMNGSSGETMTSLSRGWSTSATRASRSPRLDTVKEPAMEADSGMTETLSLYLS